MSDTTKKDRSFNKEISDANTGVHSKTFLTIEDFVNILRRLPEDRIQKQELRKKMGYHTYRGLQDFLAQHKIRELHLLETDPRDNKTFLIDKKKINSYYRTYINSISAIAKKHKRKFKFELPHIWREPGDRNHMLDLIYITLFPILFLSLIFINLINLTYLALFILLGYLIYFFATK